MKIKGLLSILFFAAGILVSCSKEGTDIISEGDQLEMQNEDAIYSIVRQLTGTELTSEDLENLGNRTYEATYGDIRDESNPLERSVLVRDAATAEAYFRDLVCESTDLIRETMVGLEVVVDGLGSLTFYRTGGNGNVGYADIDIPCIPHLERISYKTEEQWGDNALWESPCRYGDVYVHEGRYYLCVKESKGNAEINWGYLVCMEAARGTNYEWYLDKEQWGCWRPKERWGNNTPALEWLNICADPDFLSQKRRIVKRYPGKVFPYVYRWSSISDYFQIGDKTWGFGNLEPGFSHATLYHDNLFDEKSNSYNDRGNWKDVYCFIIRDATEGNYRAKKARWWRRCHGLVLPWVCVGADGSYGDIWKYTSKGGWEDYFEGHPILYTMQVKSFTKSVPSGFFLEDI